MNIEKSGHYQLPSALADGFKSLYNSGFSHIVVRNL